MEIFKQTSFEGRNSELEKYVSNLKELVRLTPEQVSLNAESSTDASWFATLNNMLHTIYAIPVTWLDNKLITPKKFADIEARLQYIVTEIHNFIQTQNQYTEVTNENKNKAISMVRDFAKELLEEYELTSEDELAA